MSFRPLIFVVGSCAIAFVFALMALSSGAGFLTAFFIYSFGGSATLVAFSLLSFLIAEFQSSKFAMSEGSHTRWANGV